MNDKRSKKKASKCFSRALGFTMTESLITVSIIGTISAIAVPEYIAQRHKSCQAYPESIISQTMSQLQAFNDEYGVAAENWGELNKIATLMTSNGVASSGDFEWIELPSCDYKLEVKKNGNLYTLIAAQNGAFSEGPMQETENANEIAPEKNTFNVIGCLNVTTGASDIRRGNGAAAASTDELRCT